MYIVLSPPACLRTAKGDESCAEWVNCCCFPFVALDSSWTLPKRTPLLSSDTCALTAFWQIPGRDTEMFEPMYKEHNPLLFNVHPFGLSLRPQTPKEWTLSCLFLVILEEFALSYHCFRSYNRWKEHQFGLCNIRVLKVKWEATPKVWMSCGLKCAEYCGQDLPKHFFPWNVSYTEESENTQPYRHLWPSNKNSTTKQSQPKMIHLAKNQLQHALRPNKEWRCLFVLLNRNMKSGLFFQLIRCSDTIQEQNFGNRDEITVE